MKISDIVNGIAIKIDESFNNATIYTEKVPQGFLEPCFVIKLLNFEHIRMVGGRWLVQPLFNIMYFPSNTGGAIECSDVSLEIQRALKDINLIGDIPMLARSMRNEMVSGEDGDVVSHNMMRFDFFLLDKPDETFMSQLEQYINKQRVNVIV